MCSPAEWRQLDPSQVYTNHNTIGGFIGPVIRGSLATYVVAGWSHYIVIHLRSVTYSYQPSSTLPVPPFNAIKLSQICASS